ncbi:MAG: N-acyl homoserine lactonase family protein [Alphaproteobacteria bacterium]|nr:N-acyl homoserine lactonase family protein [Alphaproteobacteria bacterium]
MTEVSRLYIFLCGFEILPKTVSTRGRGARFIMSEPVCAYLIETANELLLFDTGINSDNIRDPARRARYYPEDVFLRTPVVLPEHELLPQLEAVGVAPKDIGHVILSHSHCDHTGNLEAFRHAKVSIQKLEYDHAFGDNGDAAVFRSDFDFPDMDWHIVDGDWSVLPGVRALLTRGHKPGHQSLVVDLPKCGTKILAADVGDLAENFEQEILPGESVDDAAALASIRKLKRVAAETGGEIVLFHDPDYIQRVRLAPAFYD